MGYLAEQEMQQIHGEKQKTNEASELQSFENIYD